MSLFLNCRAHGGRQVQPILHSLRREVIAIAPTPRWFFVLTTKRMEVWTYPHWFIFHTSNNGPNGAGRRNADAGFFEDEQSILRSAPSKFDGKTRMTASSIAREQELTKIRSYRVEDFLFSEWMASHSRNPAVRHSTTANGCESTAPLLCFTHPIKTIDTWICNGVSTSHVNDTHTRAHRLRSSSQVKLPTTPVSSSLLRCSLRLLIVSMTWY